MDEAVMERDMERTLHLDITEKDLKGVSLGDEIEVAVTGIVKGISAPYEYEDEDGDKEKEPFGNVRLQVKELKIKEDNNEFKKLAKSEE